MSESASSPPPGGPPPPVPPQPVRPPPAYPVPPWWGQPTRGRPWWKRLLTALAGLIFLASVVLNLWLLFLLSLFVSVPLETSVLVSGQGDQVVAVWEVKGFIGQEQASQVRAFCQQVKADANVKAVILRVESGGGMVSASDQIYHLFKELRDSGKPLITSMGGVAASGGYYVSLPGEQILAEPTTATGSIGVIAGWPVLTGTMEKYGVSMVIVRSRRSQAWKAWENPVEKPADYQLAALQDSLDKVHQRFEEVIRAERGSKVKVTEAEKTYTTADGKKLTIQEVEPFDGRVFLAERALELGLVDKIGYFQDAIAAAQSKARLSKPKVVLYSRRKGLLEGIMGVRQPTLPLNLKQLEEVQTPQMLMVWKVPQ